MKLKEASIFSSKVLEAECPHPPGRLSVPHFLGVHPEGERSLTQEASMVGRRGPAGVLAGSKLLWP